MSPNTFQMGNGVPGSSVEGGDISMVRSERPGDRVISCRTLKSSCLFGIHFGWRTFQIKIEVSDMPVTSCLPSGVKAKANEV
jgi:hypothetical protein